MNLVSSQLVSLKNTWVDKWMDGRGRFLAMWQNKCTTSALQVPISCLVILVRTVVCGFKVMGFSSLRQSHKKKTHI